MSATATVEVCHLSQKAARLAAQKQARAAKRAASVPAAPAPVALQGRLSPHGTLLEVDHTPSLAFGVEVPGVSAVVRDLSYDIIVDAPDLPKTKLGNTPTRRIHVPHGEEPPTFTAKEAKRLNPRKTPPLWANGVASHASQLDCDRAALRKHLESTADYGPIVARVALIKFRGMPDEVQHLVLVGRLSAIQRILPDHYSLIRWMDAGITGLESEGTPILRQLERL